MSAEHPPVLDPDVLSELRELLEDGYGELLQSYLDDLASQIEALELALMSGAATTLGQIAHKLKSASGSVGARRLSALAFELEQMGKAGDVSNALPVLAQLEAVAHDTQRAISLELTT